jgi:hypothetical protein
MKILVNLEVIKSLKPCLNRYENYLKHYTDFEGSLEDFLDLPEVTHNDKLWVSLRLMPRFLAEVFAIDCAAASASASAYAAAYAASAAATAAAYAASASAAYAAAVAASAAYAAAGASEKQRQIEALIYLIQNHED